MSTASGQYTKNSLYRSSTAGGDVIDSLFPPGRTAGGADEPETPLSRNRDEPAVAVSTHAGAFHKSHHLAAYNSLGTGRGLTLIYDSERADPRPIVHAEVRDPGRNIAQPVLESGLTVFGGAANSPLRQRDGATADGANGLALPAIQTSVQYRSIQPGLDSAGTVHQVSELADYPSGRYGYTSTMRITGAGNLATSGLTTELDSKLVHVNTVDSPFGSGWGIAGLQQLVRNYDGSVLLIDGDGGESVFEQVPGTDFLMAPGDFSRLHDDGDGTFRRVLVDQTTYHFGADHQIASIVDRNGNRTEFDYADDGRLTRIIDPVGLSIDFEYFNGRVSAVTDPASRRTEFLYDATGNLIQIVDPDATSRTFDYDDDHRLVGETDKNGETEEIEYDDAGRIRRFTRADGSVIRYAPAQTRAFTPPELTSDPTTAPPAVSLGREAVSAVADANGNVTEARLDRAGQVIDAKDGESRLPSFVRSPDNRVTEITDGRGNVTSLTYDSRGNLTSVLDSVAAGSGNRSLFQDRVYVTVDGPTQILVRDVDGDGFVDALVSSPESDGVFLHPGLGDGTFATPTQQIPLDAVHSLSLDDINGDGVPDILASQVASISVAFGAGQGQFLSPVEVLAGINAAKLATKDLNADGIIDLVLFNDVSGTLAVSLGGGDGTFAPPTTVAQNDNASSFEISDVDSDDDQDLVIVNRSISDNITIVLGNGDGTFAGEMDLTIGTGPFVSATLADYDQDGLVDIVTTDGDSSIWFANGLGDNTFSEGTRHPFQFPLGGTPPDSTDSLIETADVNGDGNLDLVVSQPNGGAVELFLGDGLGGFASSESVFIGEQLSSTSLADLNRDGSPDVIALSRTGNFIGVRLGSADGTFNNDESIGVSLVLDSPPSRLVTADLNGDQLDDLVAYSELDKTLSILQNDGFGGLESASEIPLSDSLSSLLLRDIDADENVDIVVAIPAENQLQLVFGDGSASGDGQTLSLPAVALPSRVDSGDVNGDGFEDLIVLGDSQIGVLLGDGLRGFAPAAPIDLAVSTTSLIADDFNGDGVVDLALSYLTASDVGITLRLGLGDGTFSPGTNYSLSESDGSLPISKLTSADLNNDGSLDLIAANPSAESVVVLLGNDGGAFDEPIDLDVDGRAVDFALEDINDDGILDLTVAVKDSLVANVLVGIGDGRFLDRQDYFVGPDVVSLAVLDLFGDGTHTIYAANEGSAFVSTVDPILPTIGASGTPKSFEYDPVFSQLTRRTDELGNEVVIEIDPANGNAVSMTRVIDGLGGDDDLTTRFTYTPRGQIESMVDPLGRVTSYQYDAFGRLTATTFATGTSVEATRTLEYDAAGNVTAIEDELGHRTEYQFDALNRLVLTTETDPDGQGPRQAQARSYQYDGHGNLIRVTDGLTADLRYEYDNEHRLIRKTDALGQSWLYGYDNEGNVNRIVDRLGRVTTFQYDQRNRLAATVDAEFGVTRMTYDADDNVVRRIDQNGNVSIVEFDARNRVVAQVDPLGHRTRAVYDRADNLTSTIDPIGRRTEFSYDDVYRLVSVVDPDPDQDGPLESPVHSFAYDKADNQIGRVDPLGNLVTVDYDDRNRPIQETLPAPNDGGQLPIYQYVYDDANRLIESSDPVGRVTTYQYDNLNRLIVTELPDPDGAGPDQPPSIVHSYDVASNLKSTTDPLGNVTTYFYDELYRLVTRVDPDPDGNGPLASPLTSFTYDQESQLVAVTDPLGRSIEYVRDDLGRVIRENYPDPDGTGPSTTPIIRHEFDPVGNRVSTTDPLGNRTQFEYDREYRLTRVIEPDPDGPVGPEANAITSYTYDEADQLLATTDPLGRSVTYAYDGLGRIIRETSPDPDADGSLLAPVTEREFDAVGNLISMTDALGNRTDYRYDNLYRRVAVLLADPDGEEGPQSRPTTLVAYDLVNRPTSSTDPLGRKTMFVFDGLDRLVREIYPDPDGSGPLASPEMTYRFDLVGNQIGMTDAVGGRTSYQYDDLHRLVAIEQADPDGENAPKVSPRITYTHDVAGQLLSVTDPLGRTVSNAYDNLGRVIEVTEPDPDGDGPLDPPITRRQFDLVGNLLESIDPLGHSTSYTYDALYRRTTQISEDLDGANGPLTEPTTVYGYDLVGNLTSLTDPVGNSTRWTYDGLDRTTSETIRLNGQDVSRLFQYDIMSNLVRTTDRNGRASEFAYDDNYRVVSETWIDGAGQTQQVLTTTYDEASQVITANDATTGSRYDYQYDRLGRVTGTEIENGGSTLEFHHRYDAQSRRTALTAAVGGTPDFRNDYEFDALHRLSRVRQQEVAGGSPVSPKAFAFDYNSAGQLVSADRFSDLSGSQLVASTQYDYDGQARLVGLIHDGASNPIASYQFTYDVASRLIGLDSAVDGLATFDFDNGNQLIRANHLDQPDESYRYDENGNRADSGYQTGEQNRLQNDGSFEYQYDAEGNRILRVDSATGSVTQYEWDHRNRLTAVTDRDSESGPVTQRVEHRYDVYDRWISRTVDADGEGPLPASVDRFDYDGNQIVLRRDDEGQVRARYNWGVLVDQIMAEETVETGTVLYPLSDHLGTVRDVADESGAVLNHIRYDSFGDVVSETDDAIETLFGYTGKPHDEVTGLQNNHHRWYDAAVGQWASEDPIGFLAGDANLHRYAGNRPTTATDPTGLVIFFVHGILNRNQSEMNVLADDLAGEPGTRQEVVHFIYGRGRDEEAPLYPNEPITMDAFQHTNSKLNQAAGRELAKLINITQTNMNRAGSNEPIHVIGYSNGSNVVYEMTKHVNENVDSVLLLGGSIHQNRDLSVAANKADRLVVFTSKADGATKLVGGIGSQGVDDKYHDITNLIVSTVPNVFHSLSEAAKSHPTLVAESEEPVTGIIYPWSAGFKYDLIGFEDSFTYNNGIYTDATAWLTRYMAQTYYAPLLGLGFGEDNLFSESARLPNGTSYNKCDESAIEYMFFYYQ